MTLVKPFGSNKVLGLAVGDQGILAAEVVRAGGAGGAQARRLAEFPYPAGRSLDDPVPLGRAFAEFLKHNGFSARQAVIGLPLKWAVVRPKEVPPAAPNVVADLLRLQAEGEFSDAPNLVIEYAGESTPTGSRTILLSAVQRKRLDNLVAMAEAAGLNVRSVTLSAVALGEQTSKHFGGEGLVLHVAPGAAELAVHHDGQPRLLRHLRPVAATAAVGATVGGSATATLTAPPPTNGSSASTNGANGYRGNGSATTSGGVPVPGLPAQGLVGELRQVLALMPPNARRTAGGSDEQLVVWDGVGLGDAPLTWGDSLGISIKPERLTTLGVAAGAEGDEAAQAGRYAPAVALALSGLGGRVAPDFLHSRLAPPREARVQRKAVWATVLGVLLVGLIGYAWWDLASQRQAIEASRARLNAQKDELKSAKAAIDRATFAGNWFRRSPHYLTCMRELTRVFPDDGSAWAQSVTLKDDSQGSLVGRATSESAALNVMNRLRANGRFTDVKISEVRTVTKGNQTEFAFSGTFTYLPEPTPETAAAAAPAAPRGATPAAAASSRSRR